MASPPTSRIRFFDRAGAPLSGPREWFPALVRLEVEPSRLGEVRLQVDGRDIPVYRRILSGEDVLLADWERAGAGRHRVDLRVGRESERLDLEIEPEKISREGFEAMLWDLEVRLPVTIAIALDAMGAKIGLELVDPRRWSVEEEFERLRAALHGPPGPGLLSVLEEVARDPYRVLGRRELWVRRERARRPEGAKLARALWGRGQRAAGGKPAEVVDTRVEPTADVYENRMLRSFIEAVLFRLRSLQRLAGSKQRVGEECSHLRRQLLHARRKAAFLDEVSRARVPPGRVTMVLLKKPAYRAALEGYRAFLASRRVVLEDARLEAPQKNLPALYELWGTLVVLASLLEAAKVQGYRLVAENVVRELASGLCVEVLPSDRPAVDLRHPDRGMQIQAFVQRSYRPAAAAGLRSISFTQRPDISMMATEAGRPPCVRLFDPKYRLDSEIVGGETPRDPRPKKGDIDKMHAYRDSIRDGTDARVVEYAATLYPGPTTSYSPGVEALRANPAQCVELERLLASRFVVWLDGGASEESGESQSRLAAVG